MKYVITGLIVCFVYPFIAQKNSENLINSHYGSLGYFYSANDYWVSTQGGWNHIVNNKITQYKAGEKSSGLIDEWIQSKIFIDEKSNLYSTTFEYLTVLKKNHSSFQSNQIKYKGKQLKSNYQIIELDTLSSKLLMTADSLLFYYDYTKDEVESILDTNHKGKIFYKSNDFLIGCLSANGSGLDVYVNNKKWIKTHVLDYIDDKDANKNLIVFNGVILKHSAYLYTNLGIIELNLFDFTYKFILKSTRYKEIKDITTNKIDEVYFLDELGSCYFYNVHTKLLNKTSIKENKYNKFDFKEVFEMKYLAPYNFFISSKHNGFLIVDVLPYFECQQTKITENKQWSDKLFKNTFERNQNLYEIEDNLVYLQDKSNRTKKLIFQGEGKIYRYCQNSHGEYLSSENGLINLNDFKTIKNQLPNNKIPLFTFTTKNVDYVITTDGYLMKLSSSNPNNKTLQIGFGNYVYQDSIALVSTSKSILQIIGEQITEIIQSPSYGAVKDQLGMIWYINDDGLHHFDPNTCRDTRILVNTPFRLDKLPPLHQNGSIIFSSNKELYSIKTSCYKGFQNYPQLAMKECRIDKILANFEDYKQLKPNYQLLDFSFTLNEALADSTQYLKYKLQGLNDYWIKANVDQTITIPKLASGSYQLEVVGIGSNGYQSNSIIIPLNILPPFYLRKWFIILCALSLVLLGFLINYYRNNKKIKAQQIELDKLKALQEQRERLARDLHDEIGSGLSKIKFISSLISEKDDAQNDIQQLSSSLLGNMRDMLWSLDMENDTLHDLIAKIRMSANTQLKLTGIQLIMDISDMDADLEIAGFIRRNFLMIVKEAIHNVIKHSDASTIWIMIDSSQNQLQITIKDNGQKTTYLETNQDHTGKYGLTSMRRRALDIGATIDIQNLTTGWCIKILYPIKST